MSYGITVVPRLPGLSWAEALEVAEGIELGPDIPIPTDLRLAWERITAAARVILGREVVTGESGEGVSLWLDDEATGIKVVLGAGSGRISVPHVTGNQVADIVDKVYRLALALTQETGWSAYDEQAELEIAEGGLIPPEELGWDVRWGG